MKKLFVAIALVMMAMGVKAQDCDALMLPYFNNDVNRMMNYKAMTPEKFDWRCAYSRSAFYESDTIPQGAAMYSISSVWSIYEERFLDDSFVVDLYTLSYYAYNFKEIQLTFRKGNQVLCFSTPSSAHPYLVLNSLEETNRLASELWESERAH